MNAWLLPGARTLARSLRGFALKATPAIAAALLASCVSTSTAGETAGTGPTFLLVRHAEKAGADLPDPPLAPAGEARAQRLAGELRDAPLVAVYSTDTHRTRATALPVASAHSLEVTSYDPRASSAFARELRMRHSRGVVLVVGHSNTVPALASALCGCAVAPMPDHEYGLRYRMHAPAAHAPARLEAEAW